MNDNGYDYRSDCPINFALEIFGDRWSLLIIRDMMFAGKMTYNEFLESGEKIATNILSNRLKMLEKEGIIEKRYDPARKTKTKYIYLPTNKGLALVPLIIEIMLWSEDHEPVSGLVHLPIVEKARRNKQEAIDELHKIIMMRINRVILE